MEDLIIKVKVKENKDGTYKIPKRTKKWITEHLYNVRCVAEDVSDEDTELGVPVDMALLYGGAGDILDGVDESQDDYIDLKIEDLKSKICNLKSYLKLRELTLNDLHLINIYDFWLRDGSKEYRLTDDGVYSELARLDNELKQLNDKRNMSLELQIAEIKTAKTIEVENPIYEIDADVCNGDLYFVAVGKVISEEDTDEIHDPIPSRNIEYNVLFPIYMEIESLVIYRNIKGTDSMKISDLATLTETEISEIAKKILDYIDQYPPDADAE